MAALQLARRHLWMAFGWASLSMGAIGVVLPLLPTTPFLILAAYCFSRSSQRLHAWLLNHPILGPPIENWRAHRAISGRAKLSALAAMALILGWENIKIYDGSWTEWGSIVGFPVER